MNDEEAGKVTKSAIGAAFVDKTTADAIVDMRTDVKVGRREGHARHPSRKNAERAPADLEKRLEGSIENRINRALERIEHKH